MAIGDRVQCPGCQYAWNTRVDDPRKCPECGTHLERFEGYTTETYECDYCGAQVQLTARQRYRWHTKPESPDMCGGSGKAVKAQEESASG